MGLERFIEEQLNGSRNLYTSEVEGGRRVQEFVFKGIVPESREVKRVRSRSEPIHSHGRPRTNSREQYRATRAPIGDVVPCVRRKRWQLTLLASHDFRRRARKNRFPDLTVKRSRETAAALATRSDVILWIDIFNNFFYGEARRSAFDVLRSAGFNVGVPHRHLCRGRPPYEFGNLDEAEQHLPSIVETPTVANLMLVFL